MKKVGGKILIGVLVIALLFAAVYFFYDSPVQYVKDRNGNTFHNDNGEPIAYYTDMFGRTYTRKSGIRIYSEMPEYSEKV